MKIQVITDSTCDLPEGLADKLGIRVVPIYLRFGDKTYRDGVDITRDEFYSILTSSPLHPATSQPNPEDLTSVYKMKYLPKGEGVSFAKECRD
jgi:DegV family protein with EDD domain